MLAAVLLLAAPGCDAQPATSPIARGVPGKLAPELVGLTGWLNSDPLTLERARNEQRVVLIDFWTYTCVNCLRTLPFLRQWHERYAPHGLTIIGVHAPEFEFEREAGNVREAVAREGIRYPVAQDNDMKTWDAFENYAWPAKYLIGAEGVVRYTHLGEGDYAGAERAIRAALTDAGRDLRGVPVGGLETPARTPESEHITRELYGGYERSFRGGIYAAQREYYAGPDRTVLYVDDGEHDREQWYVHGLWRNEREAIVHARKTEQLEDYLAFRFFARSVNVVMHPGAGGAPYDVVIELDGRPLARNEAGEDIRFDPAGRSLVTVREPRMYSVLILPKVGDHDLRLRSNSSDFAMYAVTFGANASGA